MGIKGLSTFMKKKFTGWKPANFQEWSHLIIDGNNICYKLYKENCTSSFGGEYDKFSHVVKEFFEKAGFNHPIVILDGPSYDDKKEDTAHVRREQSFDELHKSQCTSFINDKLGNTSIAPLFLMSIFQNILADLNIEFRTVNGDADNLIAALANHHKCPVISSDSDFFLFHLKHGFIYFERYYEDMNSDCLFVMDEFMKQFTLQEYELCLILPPLFGNDFIEPALPQWSVHLYEQHLLKLAGYRTSNEYMVKEDNIIVYGKAFHNNFKVAKEFYSNLSLPSNFFGECVLMKDPCVSSMPDWVFKAEHFPSHLLSVYHKKSYLLPRVVEVIKMRSAWEMSRHIRQFLYGIVGIPNVTEVIRKSSCPKLEKVSVHPKFTKPPISINDLTSIGDEKSSDLVLSILKCHKISEDDIEHIFDALPSEWKLPIAATFYWYRHLDIPVAQRRDLVKSLLLVFLKHFPEKDYPLLPGQPDTTEDQDHWWISLHAFAQWQCVYFDATALDWIAREPFPVTSPASLYSGEAVMYYAMMNDDREKAIRKMVTSADSENDSKDCELFGKFLYLVTGQDEYSERRGKHAIKEKPAMGTDWTVVHH